jgi:hypothetical protein
LHLHGAVGQFQQLQHGGQDADGVDVGGGGIVVDAVLLGGQKDLFFALHDLVERPHGFFPAYEQRHNHVREHDDVAQGQNGEENGLGHDATLGIPG